VPFKVCVVAGAQDNIRVLINRQNGSNAERRLRGVWPCRQVVTAERHLTGDQDPFSRHRSCRTQPGTEGSNPSPSSSESETNREPVFLLRVDGIAKTVVGGLPAINNNPPLAKSPANDTRIQPIQPIAQVEPGIDHARPDPHPPPALAATPRSARR
jgi:hypothetical protein